MADDELLSNIGDLVFSLVISYVGALEFYFVLQHLYHWSFRHAVRDEDAEADGLQGLKDKMRKQLAEAKSKEDSLGLNVMQDGVAYKDGFRVDPDRQEVEQLKEKQREKERKEQRQKEIAAELAKQKKIEEETRKKLQEAEEELARQRKLQEEQELTQQKENERRLLEAERQRQEEQRLRELEQEENTKKLLEAERQREAEQKQRELEEQTRRKMEEEEEERESARKIFEAERQREEEQRQRELAEEEQERQRELAAQKEQTIFGPQPSENERNETAQFLDAERERQRKQKLIEENARRFLEAEEEMVVALQKQQQQLAAPQPDLAGNDEREVEEEPFVKVNAQTVKTQFSQMSNEQFTHSLAKPSKLFPGISDDASSIEPNSSPLSSTLSTQPSEEDTQKTQAMGMPYIELERQDPDGGEDNGSMPIQYTDEYLHSLDGIKPHQRPLVREDGSGRRRAFKKRRSSGSSTSSRESRASREEEVKMFTSLEEEELEGMRKSESAGGGGSDFTTIKYTSEPTLKVKGHHKRHKRSPAKDAKTFGDESMRGSLEMLGEEEPLNPWGEVVPEHYKDTEFWRREKAMSIDEEEIELERPPTVNHEGPQDEQGVPAINVPKTSSFEDATQAENEGAVNTLQQKQHSKDQQGSERSAVDEAPAKDGGNVGSDNNKNSK